MRTSEHWPSELRALVVPQEFAPARPIADSRLGNSIDRVRLRTGGFGVLKCGGESLGGDEAKADVLAEAARLAWLNGLAGAPRLLWDGVIGDCAASLVAEHSGRAAHECSDDSAHAIESAARALRVVHALPVSTCPFGARSAATDVVIHGDYALPNVIIARATVGVVDWSLLRIGDPNEDIDDAERSIRRNFGERWRAHFRDAFEERN